MLKRDSKLMAVKSNESGHSEKGGVRGLRVVVGVVSGETSACGRAGQALHACDEEGQ